MVVVVGEVVLAAVALVVDGLAVGLGAVVVAVSEGVAAS